MRILQYIKSSNGQYIDTGITINNTIEYEIEYLNVGVNQYECLIGARTSWTRTDSIVLLVRDKYNSNNKSVMYGSTSQEFNFDNTYNDIRSKVSLHNNKVTFSDGTHIDTYNLKNPVEFINDKTLYLFADHDGNSVVDKLTDCRIYSCKIWKDSVLVRDFIPMKDDVTQRVGLWDDVSKEFFTSKTSTNFIAGPDALELKVNLRTIYEDKQNNLLPENIREDITILGVTGIIKEGTLDTSDATATTNDIMKNKIAYVDGNRLVGTIEDNGPLNITPSNEKQIIESGYTSGGTIRAVDITTLEDYDKCLALTNYILTKTSNYIKLEYIESSLYNNNTNQGPYINTGIIPNDFTEIEIELMDSSPISVWERFFGIDKDIFLAVHVGNNMRFLVAGGTIIHEEPINNVSKKTKIRWGNKQIFINETEKATYTASVTADSPIYIFRANGGDHTGTMRIYSCKFYQNGSLILDLIPVKKITDGTICMVDTLSGDYYYNAAPQYGNFKAGPEIDTIKEG